MNNAGTIGFDLGSACLSFAHVDYGDSSPQILSLACRASGSTEILPSCSRAVVAVPDTEYLVKRFEIVGGRSGDVASRMQFELAQTMPEPPGRFQFDYFPSHRPNLYHGIIYRRAILSELGQRIFPHSDRSALESAYCARAIALGKGYLTFCTSGGGDLVCVADFCTDLVSLCLLYKGQIVATGHVVITPPDFVEELALRRLAMNLKTIVNFKLLAAAAYGVTVPITAFYVSGERIPLQLHTMLEQLFPVGVSRSESKVSCETLGGIDLTRYLVPLGLTVN